MTILVPPLQWQVFYNNNQLLLPQPSLTYIYNVSAFACHPIAKSEGGKKYQVYKSDTPFSLCEVLCKGRQMLLSRYA